MYILYEVLTLNLTILGLKKMKLGSLKCDWQISDTNVTNSKPSYV